MKNALVFDRGNFYISRCAPGIGLLCVLIFFHLVSPVHAQNYGEASLAAEVMGMTVTVPSTDSTDSPAEETVILFPMGEISFADSVVEYDPGALGEGTGDEPDSQYQFPVKALGVPDCEDCDSGFVSLGTGGSLVLRFVDNVLIDGPGADLHIFETGPEHDDVYVWISEDGVIYKRVGRVSKEQPALDINAVAEPGVMYPFVKLRDVPDQGCDSDPALGADIDAVGAIHTARIYRIPTQTLFHGESSRLKSVAMPILSRIADEIRNTFSARVAIDVYTHGWGTEDFTLIQTQQQAYTLYSILFDKEEAYNADYTVTGWGSKQPIATNETEEGRLTNRRIEILIRPDYERLGAK